MLDFFEKQTSDKVDSTIIWLHGLGASGQDFQGVANSLELSQNLKIRFIFPNAPKIKVTINSNQIMPAWYDISGTKLTDRQDVEGIQNSENLISELIHNEFKRGVPYKRIIVAGFSQGCAMALYTGLKFPEKLGGIIALSGYLPLDNEFRTKKFEPNLQTPLFFGHGILDEIVKLKWAKDSESLLANLGYTSCWKEYKIDHSICIEELKDISFFVNKVLIQND
jgi:phospholipase/carboxylesterase